LFGKRSATSEMRAPAQAAQPAPLAPSAAPTEPAAAEPQKAGVAAAMETGRAPFPSDGLGAPLVPAPTPARAQAAVNMPAVDSRRSEAYYTTKPRGTGLGLAIVKNNVELYEGTVRVESELGKGARFTLFFPAKMSKLPKP